MQLVINGGKSKGKLIRVTSARFLIGRGPQCQLRFLSDRVSARHAELRIKTGAATIRDLGSATGTRLNGAKLSAAAPLRDGDRIEIGPLSLTIVLEKAARPAQSKRTAGRR